MTYYYSELNKEAAEQQKAINEKNPNQIQIELLKNVHTYKEEGRDEIISREEFVVIKTGRRESPRQLRYKARNEAELPRGSSVPCNINFPKSSEAFEARKN